MRNLTILLFFLSFTLFAQENKSDSLLLLLSKTNSDTTKINLLNALCAENIRSKPTLSLKYAQESMSLLHNSTEQKFATETYYHLGSAYDFLNKFDSATFYYFLSLNSAISIKRFDLMAQAYNSIGSVYIFTGEFAKALEYCLKAQKLAEKIKNKKLLSHSLNNIANIHYFEKNTNKAVEYWEQALTIMREIDDKKNLTATLGNLAVVLEEQEKYDEALAKHFEALKIQRSIGNLNGEAQTLNNIAIIYRDKKELNKAIETLVEAHKISEKLGDYLGMASQYNNMAMIHVDNKNYVEAEKAFQDAVNISHRHTFPRARENAYLGFSQLYFKQNDFLNAYEYFKKYAEIKDSLHSDESNKNIAEMEEKYQAEKKDGEIVLLNKDKLLQKEKIRQQELVNYTIFIGLMLVSAVAFFIFRSYKQKQKANELLTKLNIEITEQKTEIEHQRDEIAEKKEIIEEKNREVTDSIRYAKRIQSAVIPSENYLNEILPEHFVLFKPRDIVSGDFYWATELISENNATSKIGSAKNVMVAAADCTGHGVPGALMSMMGINMLNSIVNEKNITQPDLVLNELRETIIRSINTSGSEEERKDGMDIVLCNIDFNKKTVQFAAANNPLYIVRNGELLVFKADKMPVGKYVNDNKPFTLQQAELQAGDFIYIFSDGYPDQFGGPDKKKFMLKNLQAVFLEINKLDCMTQKAKLNECFEDWKGDRKQIDDVLIIGIKIV